MRIAILAAMVLVPMSALANDDPCELPRVLIVLDRSSSMVTGTTPSGETKWEAASNAVLDLVEGYAGRVEFGLMMFPNPDACGPGALVAEVGGDNAGVIAAHLATPPPPSGNFTPIAESLEAVLAEGLTWATATDSHVLLVTDGWQYCDPYDPATRFSAVDAVTDLDSAGVSTFVLGFGAEVDVENSTAMAIAGGTAPDGCNADATLPDDSDLCYFQADTSGELSDAFESVALAVVDEKCDGIDNDCDGFVDNAAPGDPAFLFGPCTSACGAGQATCVDGAWTTCDATGACDDGNACTFDDWCVADACTGQAIACNDLDPCTTDTCAPDSGCVYTQIAGCGGCDTDCDDGDPCTTDTCEDSECVHTPIAGCGECGTDCDDGNPCTADACTDGSCTHTADDQATCDDGDPCTDTLCAGGECVGTWVCEEPTAPAAPGAPARDGCGCGASSSTIPILSLLLLLRRRWR